ncbi:MAG: hypothetical protein OEW08_05530 [Gammaproteobacteria bacterium]|nr:hypothetical protein [Gammaproteobacteria bacterium]
MTINRSLFLLCITAFLTLSACGDKASQPATKATPQGTVKISGVAAQ